MFLFKSFCWISLADGIEPLIVFSAVPHSLIILLSYSLAGLVVLNNSSMQCLSMSYLSHSALIAVTSFSYRYRHCLCSCLQWGCPATSESVLLSKLAVSESSMEAWEYTCNPGFFFHFFLTQCPIINIAVFLIIFPVLPSLTPKNTHYLFLWEGQKDEMLW